MTDDAESGSLASELYLASLPVGQCSSCMRLIRRRQHRVKVTTSWKANSEIVCGYCWQRVCEAAGMWLAMQITIDDALAAQEGR